MVFILHNWTWVEYFGKKRKYALVANEISVLRIPKRNIPWINESDSTLEHAVYIEPRSFEGFLTFSLIRIKIVRKSNGFVCHITQLCEFLYFRTFNGFDFRSNLSNLKIQVPLSPVILCLLVSQRWLHVAYKRFCPCNFVSWQIWLFLVYYWLL